MRQLVYEGPGEVRWREAAAPELADQDGALVRPLAVARCDLDIPMATWGIFPGPYAVGHEAVAEVVATGDGVNGHAKGDRVLVPFQVSCGACDTCKSGRFAACTTYRASAGAAFGFGEAGGGHGGAVADVLAVPHADHLLVKAPDGVEPAALCTLPDNVTDGYRTVGIPLSVHPGADVLIVVGAAVSLGLYAAASAIALGAGSVRYVDRDPTRCEAAERLGAQATHHEGDWPHRFDRAFITVDATGDAEGLTTVLRSTEPYGLCTSIAMHFTPTTPLPLLELYTRGVTFHTSRADSRRFLPEVLDLVEQGRLDPLRIPTTRVPWERAEEAWLEPATKLLVERESGTTPA